MTTQGAADPFEAGREAGREAVARQPLTEDEKRKVRSLLRTTEQSSTETRKAS